MLLSICIPTHEGRCSLLEEAIESIISQLTPQLKDQVEICISDNASFDETQSMVKTYQQRYPGVFTYHRYESDQGGALNFLKVVEIARGYYCWLMGSDDQAAENSISQILHLLRQNPDASGVTVDKQILDFHMSEEQEQLCKEIIYPQNFEIQQIYLNTTEALTNCSLLFFYMSAHIFKRRLWIEVVDEAGPKKIVSFRHFPHLYILCSMIVKEPCWIWHPVKLIKYRTQNECLFEHLNHDLLSGYIDMTNDIVNVWSVVLKKNRPTYHALMYKLYLIWWQRSNIWHHKNQKYITFQTDVKMAGLTIKNFYFISEFWMRPLPILVVPYPLIWCGCFTRIKLGKIKLILKGKLNRFRNRQTADGCD